MTALNLSETAAKDHPLYRFGARLIEVAHADEKGLLKSASQTWEAHLMASMKGELNAVGAQAQGWGQSALMSGAGVVADAISERYNEDRLKALDAKEAAGGTLTQDERVERGERQGAEYARLDQAHRNGLLELSDEDAAKYKAYNDAHKAGIAKQQAA